MNGSGPPQWRSTVWNAALTLLASAVALYVAATLIKDVMPVLIGGAIMLIVGYGLWRVHRHRDGW